jgi:hypothetical protein
MTNLDADIAHRIKAKGKPEPAQKLSRIEEIGALVAELASQGDQIDQLCGKLKHIADRKDEIGRDAYASLHYFEARSKGLCSHKMALEDAVSWETPDHRPLFVWRQSLNCRRTMVNLNIIPSKTAISCYRTRKI